jgi:hypothetical protein
MADTSEDDLHPSRAHLERTYSSERKMFSTNLQTKVKYTEEVALNKSHEQMGS